MAILILPGGERSPDAAVAMRLISQGDEVRVVAHPEDAARWRELGVHVATGDATDPDLVERAAQNCRTVVLLGASATDEAIVGAVVEGASAARVDRLIACRARERRAAASLERWRGGSVVLEQTSGRWPRIRTAPAELVAEAVDAADDLAGEPQLKIDLNDAGDLALLGL